MDNNAPNLLLLDGGKDEEEAVGSSVGSQKWASRVRKRAKDLSRQLETGYMGLARLLYQIYDTPVDNVPDNPPIYTLWGYKAFYEYAEGELGLYRRKAEQLRSIWYRLHVDLKDMDSGVRDRIVQLGWTKVRELIRVLTVENALEWAQKAEGKSYPQVYSMVIAYLDQLSAAQAAAERAAEEEEEETFSLPAGPAETGHALAASAPPLLDGVPRVVAAPPPRVPFVPPPVPDAEPGDWERFYLYTEQLELVRSALERASQLSGSQKKSHNLTLICMDFLATNDFPKDDNDKRVKMLAKLEAVFGVKLMAFDEESGKIVYGFDTLSKLANKDD